MVTTGSNIARNTFRYSEAIVWSAVLIVIFFLPHDTPSLCLLNRLNIAWCPGCGLGRAMSHAMHFRFEASFLHHWFGIPALLIIFHRIFFSIKNAGYVQRSSHDNHPLH